jgi:hypothetical protein
MTDSERKKILRKAKKAEMKASSSVSVTPPVGNTTVSASSDSSSSTKKIDDDPFGLKFMVDFDHVSEAFKFLKPLLSLLPNDMDVIELACRAYFVKGIS